MPPRRPPTSLAAADAPTALSDTDVALVVAGDDGARTGVGADIGTGAAEPSTAPGVPETLGEAQTGTVPTTRLSTLARVRPTPYLIGLFVLGVLYTLRLAGDFLIPIVIALLLDFLLSPLIRRMNKRGIPNGVAATLVVVAIFGSLGVTVAVLARPAAEWAARAPESLKAVESRLRRISAPLARLQETTARVQQAVNVTERADAPEVKVAAPSLLSRMTGQLASLGAGLLTIVFLTFFLLASGDLFMSRVIESIPQFSDKKKAVRIAREVEDGISRYLVTVTLINTAVGLATWGVLGMMGMPNALLWGVLAGVLNFIPYVGAMLTIVVIGVAAIASFESTWQALSMPLAFFAINTFEANLLTPIVLGRQFPLNSVALFVGLLFWWYLWGVAGALLAVPLMVALNVCCDHIEMLRPYGAFLKSEGSATASRSARALDTLTSRAAHVLSRRGPTSVP